MTADAAGLRARLERASTDLAVWWLTAAGPRRLRRGVRDLGRMLTGSEHRVTFYHRVADPHSLVALSLLAPLQRRYQVVIIPRVTLDVPMDIDPEPEKREPYMVMDARRLARVWGVPFPDPATPPPERLVLLANRILLACARDPSFVDVALEVTIAAWRGDAKALARLASSRPIYTNEDALSGVRRNQDEQRRRGHYQGGMLYYGGEWYWGADRFPALEQRLLGLGASIGDDDQPTVCDLFDAGRFAGPAHRPRVLEMFYSFRSPYSYLAVDRAFDLARRHGLEFVLRPVAPMVERGVPAPRIKRRYIVTDAAREARTLGVPFGRIRDPLGEAVRRCLALVAPADWAGRLREWLLSAGRAIWAEGTDLTADGAFEAVVHRAGLDTASLRQWLADDSWQRVTEANASRLRRLGLWGVPSFHLHDGSGRDGVVAWGQDRFWVLEQALAEGGAE